MWTVRSPIDWVGTFFVRQRWYPRLLALNWGPGDNWKSAHVIANLILGALVVALCMRFFSSDGHIYTRYTGVFRARPMLPIELFTSYDLCVVQCGPFISGFIVFVMFYFVAIVATVVTGLPPAQAGIQLLYFAPGMVRVPLVRSYLPLMGLLTNREVGLWPRLGLSNCSDRSVEAQMVGTRHPGHLPFLTLAHLSYRYREHHHDRRRGANPNGYAAE